MAATHGSARDEAERLVATVLAMASQATRGDDRRSSGGLGETLLTAFGQLAGAAAGAASTDRPGTGSTDRPGAGSTDRPGADGSSSGPADNSLRPGTGPGQAGWATGEAACCVCPICRIITGLRDPSSQTAERLATGAGDFAAGVASLLRSLADAGAAGERQRTADGERYSASDGERHGVPDERATGSGDDVWQAATRQARRPAGADDVRAADQAGQRQEEQG